MHQEAEQWPEEPRSVVVPLDDEDHDAGLGDYEQPLQQAADVKEEEEGREEGEEEEEEEELQEPDPDLVVDIPTA